MEDRSKAEERFESLENELYMLLDVIPEEEWTNRAIDLYREWLKAEPYNEKTRDHLMSLLLQSGGDQKMKRRNYTEARQLFEEVLQVQPRNRLAHYRLGFIFYSEKQWVKAMTHFQKALLRRRADETDKELKEEHQVKAMCGLARAYRQLSKRSLERAVSVYAGITSMEEADKLDSWIEETKEELSVMEEQERPYVLITRAGRTFLTRNMLDEYENEFLACPQDNVILSFVQSRQGCTLQIAQKRIPFPERQAQLLRLLMESGGPVSSEEIFQKMYQGAGNKSKVRRMISSLRSTIAPCFSESMDTVIRTTEAGYVWNDMREYYILYPRDTWESIEVMTEK